MFMHYVVNEGAQFIIAMRSPIVMAVLGATIYSFDDGVIRPVEYESTEHVSITREFPNDRQLCLCHL